VWLGTSVENQKAADERLPHLSRCPAVVRFISYEPALGSLMVQGVANGKSYNWLHNFEGTTNDGRAVHWVIVGGESGPKARPCNIEWIRSIVRQCKAAGVPVFVKQLGANAWADDEFEDRPVRVGTKDGKGGDMAEFPEDLRAREFPNQPTPADAVKVEATGKRIV
jgi:protein gp37